MASFNTVLQNSNIDTSWPLPHVTGRKCVKGRIVSSNSVAALTRQGCTPDPSDAAGSQFRKEGRRRVSVAISQERPPAPLGLWQGSFEIQKHVKPFSAVQNVSIMHTRLVT